MVLLDYVRFDMLGQVMRHLCKPPSRLNRAGVSTRVSLVSLVHFGLKLSYIEITNKKLISSLRGCRHFCCKLEVRCVTFLEN